METALPGTASRQPVKKESSLLSPQKPTHPELEMVPLLIHRYFYGFLEKLGAVFVDFFVEEAALAMCRIFVLLGCG